MRHITIVEHSIFNPLSEGAVPVNLGCRRGERNHAGVDIERFGKHEYGISQTMGWSLLGFSLGQVDN
ncbi:hypothetical protein BT96DRAFT_924366 [Gymnopus androsaceus JB14]|uniref:Uncharacterized protein n=1 Tax=Gymnopus androsaceus JB14 TaxID=1447944 RepID=A0A6A4H419_9AGAR|nr:hypothetical protein BT96DRAFT_924366 [Gymnopus androsaceus JB14]